MGASLLFWLFFSKFLFVIWHELVTFIFVNDIWYNLVNY